MPNVCDGVSGVTEEGCQPGVSVCLISGTGSAVREVEGVFVEIIQSVSPR
jgi:hypothetical protein